MSLREIEALIKVFERIKNSYDVFIFNICPFDMNLKLSVRIV